MSEEPARVEGTSPARVGEATRELIRRTRQATRRNYPAAGPLAPQAAEPQGSRSRALNAHGQLNRDSRRNARATRLNSNPFDFVRDESPRGGRVGISGAQLFALAFEGKFDQPVKELRVREPGGFPQFRIHADRGKAGDGVNFIHINLP